MEINLMHEIFKFHGHNTAVDMFFFCLAEYSSYAFAVLFLIALCCYFYINFKRNSVERIYYSYIYFLPAALLLNKIIRELISRERPYNVIKEFESMTEPIFHYYGDSFPSNHAAACFAIAGAVYMMSPRAGWGFFVLSVLVSVSRVYVGVHYPSDVIAGAMVAFVVMFIILRKFSAVEGVTRKLIDRCFQFVSQAPVSFGLNINSGKNSNSRSRQEGRN